MPANLTPQYSKAEEAYRKAQTAQERIECLEEMLKVMPKHKGTEKLQADLKTRLKEARDEQVNERKAPKAGVSWRIPRQGAGQVVLIGAPNSGKSRIVAELTNAKPEVAPFPFTTREPLPAMMPWEDVSVQMIDTPPVTGSHLEPYLVGMVRSTDLVLLCFDGSNDDAVQETAEVWEQFKTRKTEFARETGFADEDFSVVRVRTIVVVTRGNDVDAGTRVEMFREMVPNACEVLMVELDEKESVEKLRRVIYEAMNVIRVYTKKPGKPAEMDSPYTIPVKGTVEDLAGKIHKELAEGLKFARVWGRSVHDGQTVGREHELCDKDVVELHA